MNYHGTKDSTVWLETYLSTLHEYSQLALKQEPTEEESDRLAAFYTKAVDDPVLNFFMSQIDQSLAEHLTLLDTETINRHGNQQAWLREHLEQTLFDREYRFKIQKLLQEQGFYKGAIDGVLGQRFCAALTEFRKSLQTRLKKQGLYEGAIDGELGQRSVKAVIQFQKSRHLKSDGVCDSKTFLFLSALESFKPSGRYDESNPN
jgi:murein L,D-transpeptidase YcbB/YkuD